MPSFIRSKGMIEAPKLKQEAYLSQKDHATVCVSWNLVNRCTGLGQNYIWKSFQ